MSVLQDEFDQRKDWFNRDKEYGYIQVDKSNKTLDWEKDVEHLSDFVLSPGQKLENSRDAGGMLSGMMHVLGIDSAKTPLNFKGGIDESYIPIPSDLLHSDEDFRKAATNFIGGSLHQMSKKSFFDRSDRRTIAQDEYTIANGQADLATILKSMLSQELVDRKLGSHYPGYAKFVGKYKDHQFSSVEVSDEAEKPERMMNLLTKLVRYPATVTEDEMTEFEKPVHDIKKLFGKYSGGFPKSIAECRDLGNRMRTIVLQYMTEPEKEPPPPGGGDSQNGDENGNQPQDPNAPPAPAPPSKKEMDQAMSEFFQEKLSSALMDDSEAQTDQTLADEMVEMLREDNLDEDYEDQKHPVVFQRPEVTASNEQDYKEIVAKLNLSQASTISTLMKRKSQNWEFIIRGMKSGKLDTDRLVEAKQGVPTVYRRKGEVSTNRLCVGILIDESGSMGGRKIQAARQAAIFLHACFGKVQEVELFIYGHTADRSTRLGNPTTDVYIYKELNKVAFNPAILTGMEGRSMNRDGVAIKAVARRIREQTQSQGILIVISDGEPNADNYKGKAALKHTREKVIEASKMGFQVVQIAVDSVNSHEMFDYYLPLTDMRTFPTEMVRYLKRYLDQVIKQTVTY